MLKGVVYMHKKGIIAIAIASVIAFSGANAYAVKDKVSPPPNKHQKTTEHERPDPAEIKKKIDSALDDLVKSKVITEEQKTAIIKDMEEKRKAAMERRNNGSGNKDINSNKSGKNSKDKSSKDIKAGKDDKGGCKDGNCSHSSKNWFLRDLVENGTITQKQADAVQEAIKAAMRFDKKR